MKENLKFECDAMDHFCGLYHTGEGSSTQSTIIQKPEGLKNIIRHFGYKAIFSFIHVVAKKMSMKSINKPWGVDLKHMKNQKIITPRGLRVNFSVFIIIMSFFSCNNMGERNMIFESSEFVIDIPDQLTWVKFGDKWSKGSFKYLISNTSKDTLVNYLGETTINVLKSNVRWIEIECVDSRDIGSSGGALSDIDTSYLELYWLTKGRLGLPKIRPSISSGGYLFSIENSGTLIRRVGRSKLLFHSLDTNFLKMVEGVRIEELKIE